MSFRKPSTLHNIRERTKKRMKLLNPEIFDALYNNNKGAILIEHIIITGNGWLYLWVMRTGCF